MYVLMCNSNLHVTGRVLVSIKLVIGEDEAAGIVPQQKVGSLRITWQFNCHQKRSSEVCMYICVYIMC